MEGKGGEVSKILFYRKKTTDVGCARHRFSKTEKLLNTARLILPMVSLMIKLQGPELEYFVWRIT